MDNRVDNIENQLVRVLNMNAGKELWSQAPLSTMVYPILDCIVYCSSFLDHDAQQWFAIVLEFGADNTIHAALSLPDSPIEQGN